ncbi:MAG: DUF4870 domain-containing protein [Pirellulales bacterium]
MSQPGPNPDNPYTAPESREPYGAEPPSIVETDQDARLWGMFCHLSSFCTVVGIPGIFGPLVIWLVKKDQMPFVDDQGKESMNFQILLLICYIVSAVMVCFVIGIVMLAVVGIVHLVFVIVATIKANQGVYYRYPINLRLIT